MSLRFRIPILIFILSVYSWEQQVYAQFSTGINNTVINFACGVNCGPVELQVPHLKSTSDYSIATIPYAPFQYVTPFGQEDQNLYNDDRYSFTVPMPFGFCFYDSIFSKLVVGSNGLVTFDTTNANCFNAWSVTNPIPFNSGLASCGSSITNYPRSAIMGMYSDLDPRPGPSSGTVASPPDRRIEWRAEGTAPYRRFVISFFHIGVFGNNACGVATPNTFQLVLYESTGLIDIFVEQRVCMPSTGQGKAVLGVQDWDRVRGRAAPGKNSTTWTAQNEAFRFIPSGGASRFVRAELYTLTGALVAQADTQTTVEGLLDLEFPNVCPTGNSEQFIVRTTYAGCESGIPLVVNDTITVNKTTELGANFNAANITCGTGSGGVITVNVPTGNGQPPYQYSLNGGPLQSSNSFNNLPAGSYTAFVTDPAGCSSTQTLTISTSGSLGVTASSQPTSCAGASNGSITVNVSGGSSPLQYSLNNGPFQSSNIFTGLAAGIYTVRVNDAWGCNGFQSVTVANGSGITATLNATPTSCAGTSNGTIQVNPTSGTPPYQYSLNGGPLQPGGTFSSLAAGSYTVTVRDANNCTGTFSITVPQGSNLQGTTTVSNISCFGAANGSFTVSISNGTPPYSYSIDGVNFQSSATFNSLAPGTYTVSLRDNNNCSGSLQVTITQPPVLQATASQQPVSCFGGNNGSITVTAQGGSPGYTYSIDGTNFQAASGFNGLTAGSYTISVRDQNGCTVTTPVNLSQPSDLLLNVNRTNASCEGGADGIISAQASGGTPTYQFSLDGTNWQSGGTFNVLPGNYTVRVRDANGCLKSIPASIAIDTNLTFTPYADKLICEGKSVQLSSSSNAAQYSWSPAQSLNNATISNPVASPVTTTSYYLEMTLGYCRAYDTVEVVVNPAPVPDAGPDGFICFGQDHRLSGSGGVSYQWTPSTYLNNGQLASPLATPRNTITYSLSVVDANGCASLVTDEVTIDVTPPIIVKTFPSDTIVYAGDQFNLLATSAGTDYSWSPAVGLSDPAVPNPGMMVQSDIIYTVTASTQAGCKGEGTVVVKVYKGPDIYVPTGFTPNGDGKNDIFRPVPVGIRQLNYFRVYNRWGQLIYSTATLHQGWDGRINGIPQGVGAYVWMVEGVTRDGRVIRKRGTVTLVR